MKIISLGWGVQSFTLAAMSALGELEPVEFAIHSKTHESVLTQQFIRRWEPWFEDHQFNVYTVSAKRTDPIDNGYGKTDVPFYTLINGERGQGRRQCTTQWKILPMRKAIRKYLLGQGVKSPKPKSVEQWIGISLDEFQRMRDSDVKYIINRWPLIEKKMTRADCIKWLEAHKLEVPPKSSCTFCPFHNTAEWRRVKSNPEDWAEAVSVDRAIRHSVRHDQFVHPARKPLEEVDLRTETEKGQLSLWDEECSGICGV